MFFARSPRSVQGKPTPAQTYDNHINGVLERCCHYSNEIAPFCPFYELLKAICSQAALFHDLGKLDPKNQEILSGAKKAKTLPIHHWDAGVAHLGFSNEVNIWASILIYGHHIGLKNPVKQHTYGEFMFRDEMAKEHTDKKLSAYIENHKRAVGNLELNFSSLPNSKIKADEFGTFARIAMSCLVDADHTDSAVHCGNFKEKAVLPLRAEERLKALNLYIEEIEGKCRPKSENELERNRVRHEMYVKCSEAEVLRSIYSCDSSVGTGKTTAIMANLLKAAIEKKLRRIFIILPYTNIINQSVEVYRNAFTLPGENPEEIVSALHHRTEYDDEDTRQFSVLWNAPIIVTTAVQFFETLAAATPSALRKLHNFPGSAVFIDESHAALPAKLWVQAWEWIKIYSKYWGCHFVLASGSLIRFWKIEEFDKEKTEISEILPEDFRQEISRQEIQRVAFKFKKEKMNEYELCDWLITLPGPRLLIVNTVQSAAVIAKKLKSIYGQKAVEHISTALVPRDREKILRKIKSRLKLKDDSDWTLVATSCVEAGVDFSFRSGIREAASLVSLLQTAGRVRRNNESDYYDAAVWTIELKYDGLLKPHPTFTDSAKVLLKLAETEEISPLLCTKALLMELKESLSFREKISKAERILDFETVEEEFKVINSDTVSVLIDEELAEKIKSYEDVSWKDIQNASVQVWSNKIKKLALEEIRTGLYYWSYDYDGELIGYMDGLLEIEEFLKEGFAIL